MRNEEAKQILSAYRPSGEDAADPVFERALEQARRDPELSAWFKHERERDAELAQVFQNLPVPEEGKHSLLTLARVKPADKKRTFWGWSLALAACFALLLGVTALLSPSLRTAPELALHKNGSLGAPELLELAHAAAPLDYHENSVPELRAWLTGRGAPAPATLSGALSSLPAIGCRVFSGDDGTGLSLLCLKKGGELVHLFVAEGQARDALAMAEEEWVQVDGWNAYCWGDEDHTYVLLSSAPRETLQDLVI